MQRVRQPAPAVDQVLVGAFTEDDRYDVWRPAGTEDWLLLNTLDGAGRVGVGRCGHRVSRSIRSSSVSRRSNTRGSASVTAISGGVSTMTVS